MELITTQYGKVVTISNVGATPVVAPRNVGDEVEINGRIMVITRFEDFRVWFELETVRHDSAGQVYLKEERGTQRHYTLIEKRTRPFVRLQKGYLTERIA